MAFLFATSFYLFAILFYSISHCIPIERNEGTSTGWHYGSYTGHGGFKSPAFPDACNRFYLGYSQKLMCLLCKGFHPSCFLPSTAAPTTSTTPATTTPTSTTPTTTPTTTPSTTTTTTTTAAPAEK